MKICPYCKIEHPGGRSFGAHITNCKMNPKREEKIKKIKEKAALNRHTYKFNCKKCNKEFELILTEKAFKKGGNKKFCSYKCANSHILSDSTKEKISKSLTKEKKIFICKNCNKQMKYHNKYGLCKNCVRKDPEYRKTQSLACKGKTGGYREKGGICKQGWYKGFYCNSSWELAYIIYCLEHNIEIKRNKIGFDYVYENKIYKYYPDFIINDNDYIEIKGYKDKKYNFKIDQFELPLEIIDKNKINPYLKYVIEKYGKHFTELYEKMR